jgi:hypothetical protein
MLIRVNGERCVDTQTASSVTRIGTREDARLR